MIWTEALRFFYERERRVYAEGLLQLEHVQRQRLQSILKSLPASQSQGLSTYEQFCREIPMLDENSWQSMIRKQRDNSQSLVCNTDRIKRYEPTSGSSGHRKWIPYTHEFLSELNRAAAAWMADVYRQYPKSFQGRFYWSLSWLPEELRKESCSDDSKLFPFWQSLFLQKIFAVPAQVAGAPSSEEAWLLTLKALMAAPDLSLISVWSPTYLLKVWESLESMWQDCLRGMESSSRKKLPSSRPDHPSELWPRLALISCWDSASSKVWAEKVRAVFSGVPIQGKGLWATEGAVTIPFEKSQRLAIRSHFYEFVEINTGSIFPAWALQEGMMVQPLLTTSSGLLRYPLQDRLEVSKVDRMGPQLNFLGRLAGVDLVGEKMDTPQVQELSGQLRSKGIEILFLVGVRTPRPHYVCVLQNKNYAASVTDGLARQIDESLKKSHHYRVARELGQLEPAQVLFVRDALHYQENFYRSAILGQNKPEALYEIDRLPEII